MSRSARLEQKLDGLVSLLRAQKIPVGSDQGEPGSSNSENDEPEFDEDISPPTTFTPASDVVYSDEPSPMEAEDSLSRFREYMLVSPQVSMYSGGCRNVGGTTNT